MFGLNAFFGAIRRLTTNVNTMADLFSVANERMTAMLAIDETFAAPGPALAGPEEEPAKPRRTRS